MISSWLALVVLTAQAAAPPVPNPVRPIEILELAEELVDAAPSDSRGDAARARAIELAGQAGALDVAGLGRSAALFIFDVTRDPVQRARMAALAEVLGGVSAGGISGSVGAAGSPAVAISSGGAQRVDPRPRSRLPAHLRRTPEARRHRLARQSSSAARRNCSTRTRNSCPAASRDSEPTATACAMASRRSSPPLRPMPCTRSSARRCPRRRALGANRSHSTAVLRYRIST
jgi:hypothetical protein